MALSHCERCQRHVLAGAVACPFCSRTAGKVRAVLAGAASAAVFVSGIGCAYGSPDSYYDDPDADRTQDVTVGDFDARADAKVDAGRDAATQLEAGSDAALDSSASLDAGAD